MKQLLLLAFLMFFTSPAILAAASNESIVTPISNVIELDEEFTLLTNPVNDGTLKLRVNKTDTKNVSITIINSLGEQVYSAKTSVNKPVIDFDISKIAAGIYFLRIQSDAHSSVKKLIIQ
ncbi:MAG: T9SS type A sorting domain-containing protein [Nonlabens sp.]|uniref:T9SS type A sorting domain-containing protein n=1 Tax=Nonlabens sp. TaxID=1888209 RepID=UPI003EF15518